MEKAKRPITLAKERFFRGRVK